MSAAGQSPVLEGEREVDLAQWRDALVRRWWLLLAGLVIGAIVGVLVAVGGGTRYSASALLSLGQPLSPGGSVIPSYATSPAAVSEITRSADVQAAAAAKANISASALRNHVSVVQVGIQTGANAARATPLVQITVVGARSRKIADAANALAETVVERTTAPYIGEKIKTYQTVLKNDAAQLRTVAARLASLQNALKLPGIDPLDKLVLVSQLDNSEQRQGVLLNQQATTQQQLAFSENVEAARLVTAAKGVQTSAQSKRTALVIGALIGLVLAAIVAIAFDRRLPASIRA